MNAATGEMTDLIKIGIIGQPRSPVRHCRTPRRSRPVLPTSASSPTPEAEGAGAMPGGMRRQAYGRHDVTID
jgi:hypothetical protein